MASLRERSASRSENSCPSNSVIFRSAGCAWPRSEIPEPVVNSCLPLASPGPYNSTPSPVWYTVCDVLWATGAFMARGKLPYLHTIPRISRGAPKGATWLEARKVHSILRGRVQTASSNLVPMSRSIVICTHAILFPVARGRAMSITRRNLLHGIAAAGTVIAAGARSVKALAPNGLKQPLPGAPASGPTLLNRNENAYGPSDKVQAVIREAAAASSRYPRGEYDALRKMLAELHKVKPEQIVSGSGSSEILRMSAAPAAKWRDHRLRESGDCRLGRYHLRPDGRETERRRSSGIHESSQRPHAPRHRFSRQFFAPESSPARQ